MLIKTQTQANHVGRGVHRAAPQLYLQVKSPTARSWLFRFKRYDQTRWIGLGPLSLVSLRKAKAIADKMRIAVFEGREPKDVLTRPDRSAPSFADCAAQYVADHRDAWRNAKHAAQWSATLDTYAAPLIGRKPVKMITAADVAGVLRPIWTTKAETARRLRGRMERVLSWAAVQGFRSGENPAQWEILRHLLPATQSKQIAKHHAALSWQDVPALTKDLRERDSTSAKALLLAVLTAARTGEIIGATWSEIDLGAALWTIPGARMKAGRVQRVPLAPVAVELLRSLPQGAPATYVFPGGKAGKPLSVMALLEMMRSLRGKGATVHGLRASFKSWGSDTKQHREAVEMQLAHAVGNKVERACQRSDLLELRREVIEAWAAHCLGRNPSRKHERSAPPERGGIRTGLRMG